ncbi:MAG: RluA family pseudouridine synthase, partial [Polyangiaceae bacterium]|nr:RluA family pseudouridine synthase [Polyangiaceae bacterium]
EVTGLVTFARSQRAIDTTLEARRQGTYSRLYLALASVAPDASEGRWDWPIARHPREKRLRIAGEGRDAQVAETDFRVHARCAGAVLLHLFPRTGRTHQLRVHAARAGAPLLGDTAYGGARRAVLPDGRVRTAERVMLHCARIVLPHPRSGELREFRSPVPEDFERLWVGLGGAAEDVLF